jgi:hypothetical protein
MPTADYEGEGKWCVKMIAKDVSVPCANGHGEI